MKIGNSSGSPAYCGTKRSNLNFNLKEGTCIFCKNFLCPVICDLYESV